MPVRSRLVARFGVAAAGSSQPVRAQVSASTPLELRGPFPPLGAGLPPRYLLRNVTAGILDGDDYTVEMCVASGACVAVEPTSATKVFRTTAEPAVVRTYIEVMPGAEFHYDAGVLIPHAGASLRQITEVVLHEAARFSWSDVLSFGRLSSGERFEFARIENEFRILDTAGRVRFERRSTLVPERDRDALEAAVGGFGASGCLFRVGYEALPDLVDCGAAGMYAGHSPLPGGAGDVASVLGAWPEQVSAVLAAARGRS